jgi:hypothetical protein
MVQAHMEMLVWATCSVHGAHMHDRTHNKLHACEECSGKAHRGPAVAVMADGGPALADRRATVKRPRTYRSGEELVTKRSLGVQTVALPWPGAPCAINPAKQCVCIHSIKLGSTRDGILTVVDCMVVRCTML